MNEFALIQRYFKRPPRHAADVPLSIGDDCALVVAREGTEFAISTDMLVAGTHFLADVNPRTLGHKVLAVNLSDLAAMGAVPRYATLAASLPSADEAWIAEFAAGFFALAERFEVDLIGGDTTRGPMNFCVTIFGEAPRGQAIRRSGAHPGDDLWVSHAHGHGLGGAALGLAWLQRRAPWLSEAQGRAAQALLETPQPRVGLGCRLRGVASAMLDLSDGLAGDVGHLARASSSDAQPLAAALDLAAIPLFGPLHARTRDEALRFALSGGDDYELCFTAPRAARDQVLSAAQAEELGVSRVGEMVAAKLNTDAVLALDASGNLSPLSFSGYQHF